MYVGRLRANWCSGIVIIAVGVEQNVSLRLLTLLHVVELWYNYFYVSPSIFLLLNENRVKMPFEHTPLGLHLN